MVVIFERSGAELHSALSMDISQLKHKDPPQVYLQKDHRRTKVPRPAPAHRAAPCLPRPEQPSPLNPAPLPSLTRGVRRTRRGARSSRLDRLLRRLPGAALPPLSLSLGESSELWDLRCYGGMM